MARVVVRRRKELQRQRRHHEVVQPGDVRQRLVSHVERRRASNVGECRTWGHTVDPDRRSELESQLTHEAHDGVLRRGVHRSAGRGMEGPHRSGQDHAAAVLQQVRQRGLDPEQVPLDVHPEELVERPVQLVGRRVHDAREVVEQASVPDEDVELAEGAQGELNRALVVLERGHVAAHARDLAVEGGHQLLHPFRRPIEDDHRGTLGDEPLDKRTSDAGPAAGDEGDIALQPAPIRHPQPRCSTRASSTAARDDGDDEMGGAVWSPMERAVAPCRASSA